MRAQLSIWNPAGTTLLLDCSDITRACVVRDGEHGNESLEADVGLPFHTVFNFFQQLGGLQIRVVWGGYGIWKGRLEDPTQIIETDVALKITALGYWSTFSDITYTALWSDTDLNRFFADKVTGVSPERYSMAKNTGLYVALTKNSIYGNVSTLAVWLYHQPYNNTRDVNGLSFTYRVNLPSNWRFEVVSTNEGYNSPAVVWTLTTTGALQIGAVNITFTARDTFYFQVYNNTGGNYTYTGENGDSFAVAENIRIVTSTTNRINTTFTLARAAGTNVTATVGSTARMYVGQELQINTGGTSEQVTVLSIGSSTQFNATFVNSYSIGQAVNAHVIYPDEIIKDCTAATNALNPSQISSDTSLISSQGIDLDNAIFEDMLCSDVINDMIKRGDTASTPKIWIAQVYDDQKLIVKQSGTGQSWVTDVEDLEIVRTLTQLINSAYAIYKHEHGRILRSTVNTNAASVARFGITRRRGVKVDTTSDTVATQYRDVYLAAYQDPVPRASVKIEFVENNAGLRFQLFMVRPNDTITFRNLPPILGVTYDKIRTLVIRRRTYDVIQDTVTIDLESSMPNIDQQLARVLKR